MELAEFVQQNGWIWGFVFLFGFFYLMFWFIYLASGWKKLKDLSPTLPITPQKIHRWQSATVGGAKFNNAINVGAGPYGIYLRPTFPFHGGFIPALILGWQDIEIEKSTIFGKWEAIYITHKRLPKKRIYLPTATYKKIKNEIDTHTYNSQDNINAKDSF